MKRSGHFSVAIKQESLFSIKWDLTTFNLVMNQFHSSKKNSYSEYCRVRSDGGSLIALGGKIPDVSYVVAKLTTFCLGRSLQIRWSSATKEMNTDEWHIHDLGTATCLIGTRNSFIEIILFCFFSFGKDIVHINFFQRKALSSVWRYIKRNVQVKNAIFILIAFLREERWLVNC